MKKIFLVGTGDYSSYSIEGAFSSEEKAQEYVDFFPRLAAVQIEEYVIDEPPEYPAGKKLYRVHITVEGACAIDHLYPSHHPADYLEKSSIDDCMVTECWAKDEQHAAKIANERRTQAIAEGKWRTRFMDWQEKQKGKQPVRDAAWRVWIERMQKNGNGTTIITPGDKEPNE